MPGTDRVNDPVDARHRQSDPVGTGHRRSKLECTLSFLVIVVEHQCLSTIFKESCFQARLSYSKIMF